VYWTNNYTLLLLLHPSFPEVGFCGAIYNPESILDALETESVTGINPVIWSQDLEFIDLAPKPVQIMYSSAHEKKVCSYCHAIRTPIWGRDSTAWTTQTQYHQVTPLLRWVRMRLTSYCAPAVCSGPRYRLTLLRNGQYYKMLLNSFFATKQEQCHQFNQYGMPELWNINKPRNSKTVEPVSSNTWRG